MKLPLSWVNDYVKVDDLEPTFLADKLLNIGFEVEEIIDTGAGIEKVVVGKILDIKKHNDAEKLQVCMVDVGIEITTIVTGAHNISVGNLVPVALDGASLPGGIRITASPLRGVMSYGMMCSGKELGIDNNVIGGAEADGILLLPDGFTVGQDIREAIGLNETVLDISVTANRPDCQSVYGMAREIGAALGRKVKAPSVKYKSVPDEAPFPSVKIEDHGLCSRYTGRMITDVVIEPSPDWMRKRLLLVGIRPINNVVDITNYVLTEIGQPLHAFDVRFIDRNIIVRRAKAGEDITALDGNNYNLNENMLVIADESKPLAIAGVMGGQYSGINADTKTVFLEAARFARGSIRATSRALGLRSDSSARYEKGVDWLSVDRGRERALSLFAQLKAGKILDAAAEDGSPQPEVKTITTSAAQISALLGIEVKAPAIVKILKALEIETEVKNEKIICTVPLFREDIDNYTDLAEEVIRFYGYDKLQSTLMASAKTTVGGTDVRQDNLERVKDIMTACGAYEAMTYAFVNYNLYDKLLIPADDALRRVIRVKNPLSEEFAVMRTQLVGSMLGAVYTNLSRKNNEFRVFEVSKTFVAKNLPLSELPAENDTLCIAAVGKREDFYTMKDMVSEALGAFGVDYNIDYSVKPWLHPGISADIISKGQIIGSFGKIHPLVARNFSVSEEVYVAQIGLESFINAERPYVRFEPLPKYPLVERDLAVTVEDKYNVGELISCIKRDLVEGVELFDVYRGEQIQSGYKSVAFSLKIRSGLKTLTDAEIQELMQGITKDLETRFGAKLR